MKQEDFDLLSQYVDGELDQQSNLQVKQRLLSDPEFNQQYQELKVLGENVRGVIPDFSNEPVGDTLAELLKVDNDAADKRSAGWAQYLSLAASVVFVAVLGIFWTGGTDGNQTGLQIQAKLFSTLKSNESWSSDNMELMIVQSYLDESNTLCREYFAKDHEHNEHGISCLENGSWSKQAFELSFNQSDSHYTTASGSDTEGVEAFIKAKTLKTLSAQEESSQLKSVK